MNRHRRKEQKGGAVPPGSAGVAQACVLTSGPGAFERAIALLCQGEVVAFPTDTVYGVGVHALLPVAVARLFSLKGRPPDLPIPLLLPDAMAMEQVCADIPETAWRLAERFWPGALSLVLRRLPVVPDGVTAGRPTVAVRVPDHALARELCSTLGAPLAATSANLHGKPPPVTAEEVRAALGKRIQLILDGGRCMGGVPSTVLDLTVSPPAILRKGPVTTAELAELVPLRNS